MLPELLYAVGLSRAEAEWLLMMIEGDDAPVIKSKLQWVVTTSDEDIAAAEKKMGGPPAEGL